VEAHGVVRQGKQGCANNWSYALGKIKAEDITTEVNISMALN
jgi:hypothetical protein